jgi:hypothetical protein
MWSGHSNSTKYADGFSGLKIVAKGQCFEDNFLLQN